MLVNEDWAACFTHGKTKIWEKLNVPLQSPNTSSRELCFYSALSLQVPFEWRATLTKPGFGSYREWALGTSLWWLRAAKPQFRLSPCLSLSLRSVLGELRKVPEPEADFIIVLGTPELVSNESSCDHMDGTRPLLHNHTENASRALQIYYWYQNIRWWIYVCIFDVTWKERSPGQLCMLRFYQSAENKCILLQEQNTTIINDVLWKLLIFIQKKLVTIFK